MKTETVTKRLRILERARRGQIDIIVSTRVGEEGVDLPEAGMLTLLDTTTTPLRFYQRLGRLIRRSKGNLKYLVGIYTTSTNEYELLPTAVANLRDEGVDVSYIIANLEDKGLHQALKDYFLSLMRDSEKILFPELLNVPEKQKLNEALISYLEGRTKYSEAYNQVKGFLEKAKVYNEAWKLVRDGRLTYYIDPASAAEILATEILKKMLEIANKHKKTSITTESIKFRDGLLDINLQSIHSILGVKSVQSAYSFLIPIENAPKEAEKLAMEIEKESRGLELSLFALAKRMVKSSSSVTQKHLWADMLISAELFGNKAFAMDISRYIGLQINPEKVRLRFKIVQLRAYGLKEWNDWAYSSELDQQRFTEGFSYKTGRLNTKEVLEKRYENADDKRSLDRIKMLLFMRSQMLATIKAVRMVMENFQT